MLGEKDLFPFSLFAAPEVWDCQHKSQRGPEMMLFLDNAGRGHLECSGCRKQPALSRLDMTEMSVDNRVTWVS